MRIFALSDLHLSAAVPGKSMARFGEHWVDHPGKIRRACGDLIREGDLLLIAGDISWAMGLSEALPDLEFIAGLPGRKVLIRGNHDYWWTSPSKVRAVLPEGIFILHNDALFLEGLALAGTRLWTDPRLPPLDLPTRGPPVSMALAAAEPGAAPPDEEDKARRDEKLWHRELLRLELSLSRLESGAALRVGMVHFPPISTDMRGTEATRLLEEAGVEHCVFGHLHNLVPSPGSSAVGCRGGVTYHLTSCDYLDFIPAMVAEI